GITAWGWTYFTAGPGVRVRSPLHPWLRPSGTIGLALGVAAFAFFLFLWLYPLRKKYRWLAWTGAVGSWLRVHILAGLVVPLFAAVHAGWRFDGLIGLGYLSMLLVAISGVVGRYLYVRIPRSRSGLELTHDEVASERRALLTRIAAATGDDPKQVERMLVSDEQSYEGLGPLASLQRMIADDMTRGRVVAQLKRRLATPRPGAPPLDRKELGAVLALARRELALAQQLRMLDATRRVFGLWHVVHRPFAIMAFIAVLVHVVVALMVGAVRPF
ncbi:MAG TPA: hypothetical protein VLV15_15225, partial [Dongiaceae bacterium]|nr:hypothetical protein [Dongiaceae bacterium]